MYCDQHNTSDQVGQFHAPIPQVVDHTDPRWYYNCVAYRYLTPLSVQGGQRQNLRKVLLILQMNSYRGATRTGCTNCDGRLSLLLLEILAAESVFLLMLEG